MPQQVPTQINDLNHTYPFRSSFEQASLALKERFIGPDAIQRKCVPGGILEQFADVLKYREGDADVLENAMREINLGYLKHESGILMPSPPNQLSSNDLGQIAIALFAENQLQPEVMVLIRHILAVHPRSRSALTASNSWIFSPRQIRPIEFCAGNPATFIWVGIIQALERDGRFSLSVS